MPRDQAKPLPKRQPEVERTKLSLDEKREFDEIVAAVSKNFSRDLAAIMASQERRRRPKS